jgi:galactokinase
MQRVEEAAQALAAGDMARLGALLHRTHQGLSEEYAVRCAELDLMVARTMEQPGVAGARMMGGGFGGCTINLIEKDVVHRVTEAVTAAYRERFGITMDVYPVRIVRGVHEYTRA